LLAYYGESYFAQQKQKLVMDNFSGTLASSSRANPKICQIPAV
jgi:hypothetical protein